MHHLAPALIEFHRRYPDVRVNLSLTDRLWTFYAEQIDVAVRMGPLSDSRLMSRKIAEIGPVICASAAYVERFGVPKSARGPSAASLHRLHRAGARPLGASRPTDGGLNTWT